MNSRHAMTAFVAGAVIGTSGDLLHANLGVTAYPSPTLWNIPWWVPIEMGAGGIALLLGHDVLRRRFHDEREGSNAGIASSALWLAAAYVLSCVGNPYPVATLVALVAAFSARVLRSPIARADVVHALGAAVAGPFVEFTLLRLGVFHYQRTPTMFAVWLPGLYLHVALLAGELARKRPLLG